MKKSIIALMGLFTLVACSDESYQQADKMNENNNIVAPPTIDVNIPYESPFYEGMCCHVTHVPYIIDNQLSEQIEIIGHFGFGIYDGADDGFHFGEDLVGLVAVNLYGNSTEYLNTVNSSTSFFEANTYTIAAESMAPVVGPEFLIDDTSGGSAASSEVELIHQFGKMYYLDINIPGAGYSARIKVKFGDDLMDFAALSTFSSDWNRLGNLNGINGDLVYNIHTNEICLANDSLGNGLRSEDSFVFNGQTWYVRAFTDAGSVQITITP